MKKVKWGKSDYIYMVLLAIAVMTVQYIFLGFAENGMDSPFGYAGGDDLTTVVKIRAIGENGWFWPNENLGAPFGYTAFDHAGSNLQMVDNLLSKLLYAFLQDPVVTLNVQYLLTFALCGVTAFGVLRALGIGQAMSACGAIVFGLSPYITMRGVGHLCLGEAYFVPFSILLCMWAYQEADYLCINRQFLKNRKNLLTILFAFLIANNGIGYYAVFSCFFLCVIAVMKVLRERKITAIRAPMTTVIFITFFFVLTLLPTILYQLSNGNNMAIANRPIAESEIYGLKVIQLFVPNQGYGLPFLSEFFSDYNSRSPFINENVSSYLGIFAMIGYLISIVLLFLTNQTDGMCSILSRLNIAAVLFGTVGSFNIIFTYLVGMIRAYNRISIFIMFISTATLCAVLDTGIRRLDTHRKRIIAGLGLCVFMAVCLYDQIPAYGMNDTRLQNNKRLYEADAVFFEEVSESLETGDMVFQLPYHPYPESGPVRGMSDYEQLKGFLHQPDLRWSYGVTKGRHGDMWIKKVANLPVNEMVDMLCYAGYSGIHINRKAYTPEEYQELEAAIAAAVGDAFAVSADGSQSFVLLANRTEILSRDTQVWTEKTETVLDAYTLTTLFKAGISGVESDQSNRWIWMADRAVIDLYNYSDQPMTYALSFDLVTDYPGEYWVVIKNSEGEKRYVLNSKVTVSENVVLNPGANTFEITTNAPRVDAPNDSHTLHIRMVNFDLPGIDG